MKSNKWNLITAICDLTASICFVFVTTLQTEMLLKVLYSVAASGLLIGGIGFFCTYIKRAKANNKGVSPQMCW